jgi:hypothetical protein
VVAPVDVLDPLVELLVVLVPLVLVLALVAVPAIAVELALAGLPVPVLDCSLAAGEGLKGSK